MEQYVSSYIKIKSGRNKETKHYSQYLNCTVINRNKIKYAYLKNINNIQQFLFMSTKLSSKANKIYLSQTLLAQKLSILARK